MSFDQLQHFSSINLQELLASLNSSEETGLTNELAAQRLQQQGGSFAKKQEDINQKLPVTSIVIREQQTIQGDIVLFQTGQLIGADLRLISCENVKMNEQNLTGEALPVSKSIESNNNTQNSTQNQNIVYGTSICMEGRGKGVVVAIGNNMVIGQIYQQLNPQEKSTCVLQ